jgi:nitroimidazol reductase NimA-like FMN-containing flavoprotein (pyridoxamine 5'-phosphate oxidase superfamily)
MTRMNRSDCLTRLARGSVGRIAVTAKALPVIIPVNYVLDGEAVVFRTKADGLLARACDGNVVAFEVDDVAADGSGGWSVLVVGVARLLTGREAVRAIQLDLTSAMGDDRDQFVRVDLGRVSGRRIGTAAVPEQFPLRVAAPPSGYGVGSEARS